MSLDFSRNLILAKFSENMVHEPPCRLKLSTQHEKRRSILKHVSYVAIRIDFCMMQATTLYSLKGAARGVLGRPWPPLCKPFSEKTTYNIPWRKRNDDNVWHSVTPPPPPLKNPGYAPASKSANTSQVVVASVEKTKIIANRDGPRGRTI